MDKNTVCDFVESVLLCPSTDREKRRERERERGGEVGVQAAIRTGFPVARNLRVSRHSIEWNTGDKGVGMIHTEGNRFTGS